MQLNPLPGFIDSRIELFEKLKTEYDAMIAGNINGPSQCIAQFAGCDSLIGHGGL